MKKEPSFEQDMARLQEIVQLLENGGSPLDDTVRLYEEGVRLAERCEKKLKKAEQVIENAVEDASREKKDEEGAEDTHES